MKFVMMAIAALLLFGCSKENNTTDGIYNQLAGTWELSRLYGGWSGVQTYETGNGNTITFTRDGHFTKTLKASPADAAEEQSTITGSYTIGTASSCSGRTTVYVITFSNDNAKEVLTIIGNELTLGGDDCIADGSSVTYIKK